jgi:hypothetical protein
MQVREMRLLRESNEQLRMENKRNFEECQVNSFGTLLSSPYITGYCANSSAE